MIAVVAGEAMKVNGEVGVSKIGMTGVEMSKRCFVDNW